ncbi:MAG TPA: MoaD/ThiS family protein, partial [Acidimicrobiia bacterium]|nr:MoaD/ThiS family protein [Acidimicrobiia bacterium]
RHLRGHHQAAVEVARRPASSLIGLMKVVLRNPKREIDVPAPKNIRQLLRDLDVVPETVLVIRNDTLATHDETLAESDIVEIRPVVSGGAT